MIFSLICYYFNVFYVFKVLKLRYKILLIILKKHSSKGSIPNNSKYRNDMPLSQHKLLVNEKVHKIFLIFLMLALVLINCFRNQDRYLNAIH